MPENLPPEERAAVVKLLRDTIAADPFSVDPRIRTLKSALAKLDAPVSAPAAANWQPSNFLEQCGYIRDEHDEGKARQP